MSYDDQLPSTKDPLDEDGGRALVEAWRSSGLSGAAFCRKHRLRAQRLHYWRGRLGYAVRVIAAPETSTPPAPPPSDGFVQVVVAPPPPLPMTYVDMVVGDAVFRVRPGFDAGLLREVYLPWPARLHMADQGAMIAAWRRHGEIRFCFGRSFSPSTRAA